MPAKENHVSTRDRNGFHTVFTASPLAPAPAVGENRCAMTLLSRARRA